MVGVPRSKGCKTCLQRRVKCDEARPFCNNCTKGGRSCPGYDARVVFRDEGPRLRKRLSKAVPPSNRVSAGTIRDESDSSSSNSPDAPIWVGSSTCIHRSNLPRHIYGTEEYWNARSWTPSENPAALSIDDEARAVYGGHNQSGYASPPRSLYAPMLNQKQLLYRFSESVAPLSKDYLPSIMKTQWAWLHILPDLCGANPLLDATMRAVTLVQLGRRHQNDKLITESRPHYGTALRLLSQTLTRPKLGVGSNTLCATALLSFYEMFASSNDTSWIQHAGGVGALMRQRGVRRHRYGFGRAILRAYRYTLVIEAFQKGQPCFLFEPEWRELQAQIHEDIRAEGSISDERMVLFDSLEVFFALTTESTHLCAGVNTLLSSGVRFEIDRTQALIKQLEKLKRNRRAMKDSNMLSEQGLIDASQMLTTRLTEDPIFPVQYDYASLFMSVFYSGYRSSLGMLNLHIIRIISELVEADVLPPSALIEYVNENRDLSIKACQSIPYMLKSSFMGPFHAVFALRLASQVFQPGEPEWDWTVGKLHEIASNHLMMARHLPWYNKQGLDPTELNAAVDRSRQHQS